MKSVPIRPFVFLAPLLSLVLSATPNASAQDDIYDHIRFVNTSEAAVEIAVWNPRGSQKADTWKVEAGKTLDLVNEKGEKLRFGIISSFIKVGDAPEKNIDEVATRKDDYCEVIWNGKDFEPPTR